MARAVESSHDVTPRRRIYRQSPGERWWFAVILLPALLTAAFVTVTGASIERDLGIRTATALQESGLSGVSVTMSGRNAMLKVPTGQSQEKAIEVAQGVEGIGDVDVEHVARNASEARACEALQERLDDVTEGKGLTFGGSSTLLSGPAVSQVSTIGRMLVKCPSVVVSIDGHTDASVINAPLVSLRRAETVRDALARAGVKTTRMKANGYGDSHPASTEDSSEGRALNNRVNITLEEE